ncbi:sulfatase-like hydrolase/transferase [Verrucomicrobiales bacterium]|nr:sulfatase-like hydrolase/transferase [Verrucomicrobiales bacterium]
MIARLFILVAFVCCSSAKARPNILFIQTDDQAPWALGLEHGQVRTPHMDRLFSEGMRLTNCFTVTPVCSPSRASLMTSRYGSELGITDWINRRVEPKLGLAPDLPNWVRLLRSSGYRTALIGKWHLGTEDAFHPLNLGFDYFMGHREGGWQTKDPILEKDGVDVKLPGLTTDVLADEVIDYLDHRDPEKPFLLCWHTRAPHTRWLPVDDADWEPFAEIDPEIPNPEYPKLNTKRVKRMTREYLASVHGVDRNLGRVLAKLDQLELREDTVVIFTSDHGYSMGHHGIWHKGNGHWVLTEPPAATDNIPKNQRPNLYDQSLRVPTAIRWPGKIDVGSSYDGTVSNLDWFPTILKMAEVKLPATMVIRGREIPYDDNAGAIEPFFAQYSTHHQSRTHMRAIRTSSWKLIRDFLNPDRDELYHLEIDPGEHTNLIDSPDSKIVAQKESLHERLVSWMASIKDPVTPNGYAVTDVAGTGDAGYRGDGKPAVAAQLNNPFGIAVGPDGCLYVCDTGNHVIRRIDDAGIITTVAGNGTAGYSGDGGPAKEAQLHEPYELRFDEEGHLFFVEMKNHLIRRVDQETSIISTIAGTGQQGFSGDGGSAREATFSRPHSIQFGPDGDLYICDIGNHRLRRVNLRRGTVTTFCGNGEKTLPRNGQSISGAPLFGPRAIDFDHEGNLWLALREGNRLYKLRLEEGTLHWMAGTGKKGFSGHGGPAKKATLSGPKGVSVGPDGRVYLADTESHSIRIYNPKNRLLSRLSGDGAKGVYARPHGVFVNQAGTIYVGDSENHRIAAIKRRP